MDPEEKARLEAETKKLEAEAESLRNSGWNKPATWLPMLAAPCVRIVVASNFY